MIKMLVVDDELDVCDFVKNFFEERNYTVFTALNGEDALRITKTQKPNIILLDIRMKRMDGIETLRKIREIDKNVDVVMVTAVEDEDKMVAARKLDAKDYITKPLVLEELEHTVYERSKGLR
ncbi:MAG: response regulator [Candidatus Omnitrophica bacterium]|nr:response regulator [candidate division WOR-3 bacterium]MCK4463648.1 response regulator [Candidatus Omnitrophota bacterium]